MATNPFDEVVINPRERPLSSDINAAQSQIYRTLRTVLDQLHLGRLSIAADAPRTPLTGFLGGGFKLRPRSPADMNVVLPSGLGFLLDTVNLPSAIGGVSGIDDLSRWKPLQLGSDVTTAVPAAPGAPNSRIDIIEVIDYPRLTDASTRDVLNAATGVFEPLLVQKTLAWNMEGSVGQVVSPANSATAIGYKVGVAGNPPSAPATSPGYTKIGEILVGSGVVSIDADVLKDLRKLLYPGNVGHIAMRISAPCSGGLFSTMQHLAAPPGVQAVVVDKAADGTAEIDLYLFAGDLTGMPIPSLLLHAQQGAGGLAPYSNGGILSTIDVTQQGQLISAAASPATKIAVGQQAYKWNIKANGAGGATPVIYTASITFAGG